MVTSPETLAAIRRRFDLEPLPLEGGHFRQTWQGAPLPDGRPCGTAILVLLSNLDDEFSAMHRLPTDEIWLYHAGDPVELVLLDPGSGAVETRLLGADFEHGQEPQIIVRAGVWMGARPDGAEHDWSLFSCTMTPGFLPSDYEGGDAETLSAQFPAAAEQIARLCRPGTELRLDAGSPPD